MLNNPSEERPTCGVVIEKNDQGETICPEPATQQITMVDPDDKITVTAILLVCERHDHELEAGESLIFVADNGVDHIGVQYDIKKEE